MGNCGSDEGKPILLVFDFISFGTYEIKTMDGLKLKNVVDELAKRMNIKTSYIGDIVYKYDTLDKYKKIRDLNIPYGAKLVVKFSK